VGWAICNGANGTRNRNGRTPIGYDATNYPTIGAVGGSKDAVVVSHSHIQFGATSSTGGSNRIEVGATASGNAATNNVTETVGVSGTDKNMQPYIVTLFIQRIA
jgi:hypothetical protein